MSLKTNKKELSNSDKFELITKYFICADFKVPIRSFIEEKCLIFSTEISYENKQERLSIFNEYKIIV